MQNLTAHRNNIRKVVDTFDSITLRDLDSVSLLNRVDSKFFFDIRQLPMILEDLVEYYKILDINSVRQNQYDSIYFDTPDLDLYYLHHNDRKNRFKIRYRKYVDSNLSFFELKMKNNKGRTIKKRFKTDNIHNYIIEDGQKLLMDNLDARAKWDFQPSIKILFDRLTFADKNFSERATIDLNLTYQKGEMQIAKDRLVIVELKQGRRDRKSPMFRILKKNSIYPYKISKYCLGILSCYPKVKYNRFKKKMIKINSLTTE